MEHALLVLGLLKLQEMHGYHLGDLIDKRLSYLTDLKKPTLYHLLAKLEASGDVAQSVSRAGHRPERRTFRLTAQGKARFEALLRRNLQAAPAAYFDDDIGLLFLSELPAAEARGCLDQKRAGVAQRIAEMQGALARHAPGTPAYYTLQHHVLHLQAEHAWLDGLQAQLKKRAVREDILRCIADADAPAARPAKLPAGTARAARASRQQRQGV